MSGKGNCYDNAMVETVFKTIKSELKLAKNIIQLRPRIRRIVDTMIGGMICI